MKAKTFQHLSSFGISGAVVPVKKIESLLSTQLQVDVLSKVLKDSNFEGPSLTELREPDLGKVNYTEKVSGGIQAIWQPIVEDPLEIAPPQLLERLNHAWNAAERKIGDDVQKDTREIFHERAKGKAEIIKERAFRLATEKGIPCVMGWLHGLKEECSRASKLRGQEVVRYEKKKEKQKAILEELKESWNELLSKASEVEAEPLHVARNFLIMAGIVLLIGLGLWILSIPVNSILGVAGGIIAVLIALKISWPLLKHLSISGKERLLSTRLASTYKSISLLGLYEMTKRMELEYYAESLPSCINGIISAYQERYARLERKREELTSQEKGLRASLHVASATIRTIVRESALIEWYKQGELQSARFVWIQNLCSIESEPSWEEISNEARISFDFLREISIEEEIFKLYKEREERLGFLMTLREAAIGKTPGEPLLSIDFSITGERPIENHLIIEMFNPEHSKLAKEIQSVWGDTGVGLSIVPSTDPSSISFIGIVYGFPFEAIKEFDTSLNAFEQAKKNEGRAIYPVLYPEGGAE
jgi:hypothetical protein